MGREAKITVFEPFLRNLDWPKTHSRGCINPDDFFFFEPLPGDCPPQNSLHPRPPFHGADSSGRGAPPEYRTRLGGISAFGVELRQKKVHTLLYNFI